MRAAFIVFVSMLAALWVGNWLVVEWLGGSMGPGPERGAYAFAQDITVILVCLAIIGGGLGLAIYVEERAHD